MRRVAPTFSDGCPSKSLTTVFFRQKAVGILFTRTARGQFLFCDGYSSKSIDGYMSVGNFHQKFTFFLQCMLINRSFLQQKELVSPVSFKLSSDKCYSESYKFDNCKIGQIKLAIFSLFFYFFYLLNFALIQFKLDLLVSNAIYI